MSDNNNDGNSSPPAISYTRKRTTTKTRTAASSARRRKNIPVCHASGGGSDAGGKDQHSWFARKSAGWTDAEIKSHLVSGGASKGGKSFSMVGDVILGDGPSSKNEKKKKKAKQFRVAGPKFAWEEEDQEEEDQDENQYNVVGQERRMTAAAPPTLSDIMDEQDEIDFMSPLKVGKQYQTMKDEPLNGDDDSKKPNTKQSKLRSQNAALAELAQVSGMSHGGGQKPTSSNESIGWRLLRVLGYRSRLGVAFVPLSGHVAAGGRDVIDNEVMKELEQEGKPAHEAKWLASKRLRAIRLPSIVPNAGSHNKSVATQSKDKTCLSKVLTIPPPKINRHGMGYDPFKNAPEFREFHERRRALAQQRGRAPTEDDNDAAGGARGDRYLTDNLRKDERQALWDKSSRKDGGTEDSDDDDMSDPGIKGKSQQHSHYAADRNYTDFIGTKASSGFALEDEDDANVYQDGEMHAFSASRDKDRVGGDEYTTEIHSPVASDEEDHGMINGGTLFGKSETIGSERKALEKRASKKSEDKGKVADAWSAWGVGKGSEDTGGIAAMKTSTMDGKPPLPGFTLGRGRFSSNADTEAKTDAPTRWTGPTPPSGYVVKRHVFPAEDDNAVRSSAMDGFDTGLGLDLQRRQQHQRPSRSLVPKVLPPSSVEQKQLPPSGKMLAKDGSEMNFHAVKESMKSRFVSSTGDQETSMSPTNNDDADKQQNLDKEEWVQVTVTPWVPTRLLCKRWGIPVPSTAGEGSAAAGKMQSKEENYFRQTVFEPAVADQRQKGGDATKGSNGGGAVATNKTNGYTTDGGMMLDTLGEEGGPPPTRPSADVFQSIFDAAESDMEISSSDDDDDDDEPERNDDGDASRVNHLHTASRQKRTVEGSTSNDTVAKTINSKAAALNDCTSGTSAKHHPPSQFNNDNDASSTDGNVSSSSQSSKQRRKRHRHDRNQSRDDSDDNTGEDQKKRKKIEKHRKKHHRRRDSSVKSDDESRGYGSEDDRRRRKKKHKHRSHSRHKRSKHRT